MGDRVAGVIESSAPIVVGRGQHLHGEGPTQTVVRGPGDGPAVILDGVGASVSNLRVERGWIEIRPGCHHFEIRRVWCNGSDFGIRAEGYSPFGAIVDFASIGAGTGIRLAYGMRAVDLDRVRVGNCQTGIEIHARPVDPENPKSPNTSCNDIRIRSARIEGCKVGLSMHYDGDKRGSYCYSLTLDGGRLEGNDLAVKVGRDVRDFQARSLFYGGNRTLLEDDGTRTIWAP